MIAWGANDKCNIICFFTTDGVNWEETCWAFVSFGCWRREGTVWVGAMVIGFMVGVG